MQDIAGSLREWLVAGERVGLATVVDVSKSAPRQPGAAMGVGPAEEVVGSVSGGCVEGAVYELAQQVMAGESPRMETFGYSDDDAFAVGLTCGGIVSLFVEMLDPADPLGGGLIAPVIASIDADEPVAIATIVSGEGRVGAKLAIWPDRVEGTLDVEGLQVAVVDDARGMLSAGVNGIRHYGPHGERRIDTVSVWVQSFAPAPRMLVFGAIDFAAAVARAGKFLGYRVTVCDARAVFATKKRFPEADEVVVEWPHRYLAREVLDERTVICVLTHDPKFDVPLLEIALRAPAAYIGAMGSRRTHEDRLGRLKEIGMTDDELARLRSPIGLDIGARTPEETAVSIAAEIISLRWGGSGQPLTATEGAIHGTERFGSEAPDA